MTGTVVRPLEAADLDAVRELNAANVPAVGVLDDDRVALFRRAATWWVALHDDTLVATLVGLREGVEYASPNYRWFADRHPRFAYVDRIAVAPAARGTGLAQQLYERWFALARTDEVPVVCAEVNVVPPNPRSTAFHLRLGFSSVAELAPYDGDERVALMERALAAPADG